MRDTTPEHVAPHTTYGAFIKDLKEKDIKILPEPELRDKIAQARDAGLPEENRLNARNEVFDSVLRVLPFVIRGLPTSGIPPEELIGEAAEAVDACINNFDLEHVSPKIEDHPRFSSYVIKSLRLKLASPRSVVRVGELASIPPNVEGLASSMRKARELFMQEEQREPTQEEWYKRTVKLIGETKGFSALKDAKFQAFEGAQLVKFKKPASIGKPYARGYIDPDALSVRAGNIGDDVADENVDTAEEAISNVIKDDISEALGSLTSRQRTIIEMRYGLGLNEEGKPRHEMTLEEVSRAFGVTRNRISQIEMDALKKLRHPVLNRKIRSYLEDEPSQDVKPNPNYAAWKLKEGL